MKINVFIATFSLMILTTFFVKQGPMSNQAAETPEISERALNSSYIVCIDPGHQRKGNSNTEPMGPGSDTMKAKVSSGTTGKSTGIPEYKLNLQVGLYLKETLTEKGYHVVMTRETHDVDISNAERARLANQNHADCFIRLHADGSDDRSANGIMTMCQTKHNPYVASTYKESRLLSELILKYTSAKTGAKARYVSETDKMTGINWCKVPVTIVEMGFMSNPDEDKKMATEEYRRLLAEGIAEGTEAFFKLR